MTKRWAPGCRCDCRKKVPCCGGRILYWEGFCEHVGANSFLDADLLARIDWGSGTTGASFCDSCQSDLSGDFLIATRWHSGTTCRWRDTDDVNPENLLWICGSYYDGIGMFLDVNVTSGAAFGYANMIHAQYYLTFAQTPSRQYHANFRAFSDDPFDLTSWFTVPWHSAGGLNTGPAIPCSNVPPVFQIVPSPP